MNVIRMGMLTHKTLKTLLKPDVGKADQPVIGAPFLVASATSASRLAVDSDALRQAASTGFISDGELKRGYLAYRAPTIAARVALAVRLGDVIERLAAIEAQLQAIVYAAPPPAPVPTALRDIPSIIPFAKGQRHA